MPSAWSTVTAVGLRDSARSSGRKGRLEARLTDMADNSGRASPGKAALFSRAWALKLASTRGQPKRSGAISKGKLNTTSGSAPSSSRRQSDMVTKPWRFSASQRTIGSLTESLAVQLVTASPESG
eukprot:scaffold6948_cov99-Isochrysis_galbana.AAC.4